MKVRLAFLKRYPDGSIKMDGFELADDLYLEVIPQIGWCLVLPDELAAVVREKMPELQIMRRFEVVSVDLRLGRTPVGVDVYIAEIKETFASRTKARTG
jgi:hypothetical protein